MWLDTVPKDSYHMLTNDAFETSIRLRLFLPYKRIRSHTICRCGIPIDPQGLHWCTGCNFDGVRHRQHDNVRDHVALILNRSGIGTEIEQRDSFLATHPETRKRCDITAYNLPNQQQPHLIDIQLTSPVPPNGGTLTLSQAKIPLLVAHRRASHKRAKYKTHCAANNLGFIPAIFEITCRMETTISRVLHKALAAQAIARRIPFSTLWKFWISSLQFIMLRSLNHSLSTHASHTYGSYSEGADHETSIASIRNSSYINPTSQDTNASVLVS
jgi:hypothetical protein